MKIANWGIVNRLAKSKSNPKSCDFISEKSMSESELKQQLWAQHLVFHQEKSPEKEENLFQTQILDCQVSRFFQDLLLCQIWSLIWIKFSRHWHPNLQKRQRSSKFSVKKSNEITFHGGLNQEKYLKSCLGLGHIFFESTAPEVFKNTLREIANFRPS